MKKNIYWFGIIFCSLTLSARTQVIDTTPTWSGMSLTFPFGEPTIATFGQTFIAPAGYTQLNTFTFFLNYLGNADDVDFAGYVQEWNSTLHTVSGPLLYQSPQLLLAVGHYTLAPFVFNTGPINLDPAKQYVAYVSASGFFDGIAGYGGVGAVFGDPYGSGNQVSSSNGDNFSALSSIPWSVAFSQDAAFRAQFSSVPESSTFGAIGALSLIVLAVARKSAGSARLPS